MKISARLAAVATILGYASSAFAASGAEYEGNSFLLTVFLGFGALVVAFQFVPGIVLLGSMLKGVFSAAPEKVHAIDSRK